MNFDIKNPENLKGVDLIWIFEVLETLLGTQNWGISNLCSSGCKLGKPDSADKRGPLSAKERKEKKKKRKKKKALAHGSGFSLNLTSGTRVQRLWLTWAAIKRKQEDCLNSAPKRRNDPSARCEADEWGPLSDSPSPLKRPCAEERREKGRKRGRERNLLIPIPLGSSKARWRRRRWSGQLKL